jgi:hypothetical protein
MHAPSQAYEQLADAIFAPVYNQFTKQNAPADVGQTGDDKLRANFKRQYSFADVQVPELTAMMEQIRNCMTEDQFADMLVESTLEVTHLSLQIFNIDGEDIGTGLKTAAAGTKHCPSVYHVSRDRGYKIAQSLNLKEDLGLNPETVQVMIPGMPPFFFGDKTAGVDYFPLGKDSMSKDKGDSGLAGFQGNQNNDAGLHVSIFNRRDAAGLILTAEPYKTPVLALARELVAKAQVYKFLLDQRRVKLVQGQKRNDHLVGGACYIGMETDSQATEHVHTIQRHVMPAGFKVDHSQQLHVSIATIGPKDIAHYKSQWCLEQMSDKENPQKLAFRQAHFKLYAALREKQDVDDLTDWGKYEAAVVKITSPVAYRGIGKSYLLVDVLGFKTSVVSPAISATDPAAKRSSTIWNGNWATDTLRKSEFAMQSESIVEWIKPKADGGNYEEYINEDGNNSLKASVTAAEYYAMVEKSYAGEEAEFTQKLIDNLQASLMIPKVPNEEAPLASKH